LAVLLGRLDQPLRFLLSGAPDHRRGNAAVALLDRVVRVCAGGLYADAGVVRPVHSAARRAHHYAGLWHVAELCAGCCADYLLRAADGRAIAASGSVTGAMPRR